MTEPSAEALKAARKLSFATIKEIAVALDAFAAQTVVAERARPSVSDLDRARQFVTTYVHSKERRQFENGEDAALLGLIRELIADIRAEAVSAERERCARIAADKATCGCDNKHGRCHIDDVPLAIAAAIRAVDDGANR